MIGLLFPSSMVNYINRVNISVATPVIIATTGRDKGQHAERGSGLEPGAYVLENTPVFDLNAGIS